MEEKIRTNPFSITNILGSPSTRESGRQETGKVNETGGSHNKPRQEYSKTQRSGGNSSEFNERMEYDLEDWRSSAEGKFVPVTES